MTVINAYVDRLSVLSALTDAAVVKTVADPKKFAIGTALSLAAGRIATEVEELLGKAYDKHVLIYGNAPLVQGADPDMPPAPDAADAWHDRCDTIVQEVIGRWSPYVSASWDGENTIDTRLEGEGNINLLARKAGAEIAAQMMGPGTSEAQLLRNFNITGDDLTVTVKEAPPLVIDEATVRPVAIEIIGSIADLVRGSPAQDVETPEFLDLAVGDAESLAEQAWAALGITPEEAHTLQMFRRLPDVGTPGIIDLYKKMIADPTVLTEMMAEAAVEQGAQEPLQGEEAVEAAVATQEAETPPVDPRSADFLPKGLRFEDLQPVAGEPVKVPTLVLRKIKDHAGAQDKEIAEALGVSRTSYGHKVKGSGKPIGGPAQIAQLLAIVQADHAELSHVISALEVLMSFCHGRGDVE